jgi:hypothetical protein
LRAKLARSVVIGLAAVLAGGASAVADWERIPIEVAFPALVETESGDRVLVTLARGTDHPRIDVGREVTRWVRREISRSTALKVLNVEPPPIPEQRAAKLAVNDLFWKRLGEDFDADLIIGAICSYTTEDRSGFVTRDRIDPLSGQMIRETVFADRTGYNLQLEIFVLKGDNGALLHNDVWERQQILEGPMREDLNVLLMALEELKPELMGLFLPTRMQEPRYIWVE